MQINNTTWEWPEELDALVAAPQHHILLFENDKVRVLDTLIKPGEITEVHTHKWAASLYIISWSDFTRHDKDGNVVLDSRTLPETPSSSTAFWSEPLIPHALKNIGNSDIHIISVEIKNKNQHLSVRQQIANHFREVFYGGNWTSVDLKNTLADITWQEASTKVNSFNSIAALLFHIHYFIHAACEVLNGKPLDAHDKYSFDLPPICDQKDWENLVKRTFTDVEKFATLIEQMPESKLWEDFSDNKYGNFYRNIHGIIEHTHYHLGQMVLLKKLLRDPLPYK